MSTRWLFQRLRTGLVALICLWAGSVVAVAQPVDSDDRADVRSSFAELDRYGHWIQHREWGTVWVPDVDDDWRPYTVGRWVNTEEHGWYWDSDEPFGWAVYHYGRWVDDPDEGWIWVPGTQWGPAWVAWRYGEDAVGWAPLPPGAIWEPERGVIIEDDFYHAPRYAPFWIFVAPRFLLAHRVHRHCWPASRNASYFHRTHPATRYHVHNRRVFNQGIRVAEVERLTKSRVASTRVLPASRPMTGSRRDTSSAVYAYRPAIEPSDRWRSGSRGDWRKFEPSSGATVRQTREGDGGRRPEPGARDGRERPTGSIGPTGQPPAARFAPPPGDAVRRDRDDRVDPRVDRGGREGFARRDRDEPPARLQQAPPRPLIAPTPPPSAPRAEPPRRSFESDRPRDSRSYREGPSSDRGPAPRAFIPPPPRPHAAPPPRPQAAPPPARVQSAPPPARVHAAPPPRAAQKPQPKPGETPPGPVGRRG